MNTVENPEGDADLGSPIAIDIPNAPLADVLTLALDELRLMRRLLRGNPKRGGTFAELCDRLRAEIKERRVIDARTSGAAHTSG